MPRPTKYTRELLEPIVERSASMAGVLTELGIAVNGGNHRMLSVRIRYLGLDTGHFTHGLPARLIDAIPKPELARVAAACRTVAQVLERFDLPVDGRPHKVMKDRLRRDEIDISHFVGHGWSRGLTARTDARVHRVTRRNSYPDEVVFAENSPLLRGPTLVRRLTAQGRRYACEICGIVEWLGRRLVLPLDHINGINNDNRRENLRLLCPNCHSQTPTFSNRRR